MAVNLAQGKNKHLRRLKSLQTVPHIISRPIRYVACKCCNTKRLLCCGALRHRFTDSTRYMCEACVGRGGHMRLIPSRTLPLPLHGSSASIAGRPNSRALPDRTYRGGDGASAGRPRRSASLVAGLLGPILSQWGDQLRRPVPGRRRLLQGRYWRPASHTRSHALLQTAEPAFRAVFHRGFAGRKKSAARLMTSREVRERPIDGLLPALLLMSPFINIRLFAG